MPFITKYRQPPSSDAMHADREHFEALQEYQGRSMSKFHFIGKDYQGYLAKVTAAAGFSENLPPVYMKVLYDSIVSMDTDPLNFRSWKYVLRDAYNFEKVQDPYNLQ